ncbi:endo-beta-D-1,4-glucanase [Blakeslea trispora]|nr:endo-beta-D-1,4-glucanase [Blakeslea trispora]
MKFSILVASISAAVCLTASAEAAKCSAVYHQCGGKTWTGPTCCESGSTCVTSNNNEYYSQCVPNSQAGNDSNKAKPIATSAPKPTTAKNVAKPTNGASSSGYSPIPNGIVGKGTTTRYWDCCKESCSWNGKAKVTAPVDVCAKNGVKMLGFNTQSGCGGGGDLGPDGPGYTCNNNQPWAVNDNLAYGFAAATLSKSTESGWCCACMELTFTSSTVKGKKMVVQITNTGDDGGPNAFDLHIPGGGVGQFNGCTAQWGAPADGWGKRYGGVSSLQECSTLPAPLQPGCKWRFGWFKSADNPTIDFKQVTCPKEIIARSGCDRL